MNSLKLYTKAGVHVHFCVESTVVLSRFVKRFKAQIELRTTFLDTLTTVFGEIGLQEDYILDHINLA